MATSLELVLFHVDFAQLKINAPQSLGEQSLFKCIFSDKAFYITVFPVLSHITTMHRWCGNGSGLPLRWVNFVLLILILVSLPPQPNSQHSALNIQQKACDIHNLHSSCPSPLWDLSFCASSLLLASTSFLTQHQQESLFSFLIFHHTLPLLISSILSKRSDQSVISGWIMQLESY